MIIADQELASRIEMLEARSGAAAAEAFCVARGEEGPFSIALAGGLVNYGGVDSPMSQAIGLAIGSSFDEDAFSSLETFYRIRKAPALVFVTPFSSRTLSDRLGHAGYLIAEYNAVFARPISSGDRITAAEGEIEVRRATPDLYEAACRVAANAFANEHLGVEELANMMRPMYDAKGFRAWIARIDGRVVGSATSFVDEELRVVGLFGAATDPEFRRRGVQRTLLERRLSDALDAGCELAMVTTEPGSASHRNVARRGFDLLYTKMLLRKDLV